MIICLGFPKSATTSFQTLFTQLGYSSYHWTYKGQYIGTLIKNNKLANKKLLSFLDLKELPMISLTQLDVCLSEKHNYWPQLNDYRRLYREYPDAIFILNKRNPKSLLKSFTNWNRLKDRIIQYNPELLESFKGNTDEKLLKLFAQHYRRIETFFARRPNAKFLTFEVGIDTLSKLEKYIDLKGHITLPLENQSK
jgi:hypothetical protein